MRSILGAVALCCAITASLAVSTGAQNSRQPGLYEVTSKMTWQQSPLPPGMAAPPNSPFSGAPHTNQVCVTQAQIDKYAGPPPQTRGDCQMSNLNKTATGMSGTLVCTGQMAGSGDFESHWTLGEDKGTTKVHFTGTMTMGPRSAPVEWTLESTSVFKGPDCGSVKPIQAPGGR
jgi:Protein of unknown function (DUF3617)